MGKKRRRKRRRKDVALWCRYKASKGCILVGREGMREKERGGFV